MGVGPTGLVICEHAEFAGLVLRECFSWVLRKVWVRTYQTHCWWYDVVKTTVFSQKRDVCLLYLVCKAYSIGWWRDPSILVEISRHCLCKNPKLFHCRRLCSAQVKEDEREVLSEATDFSLKVQTQRTTFHSASSKPLQSSRDRSKESVRILCVGNPSFFAANHDCEGGRGAGKHLFVPLGRRSIFKVICTYSLLW